MVQKAKTALISGASIAGPCAAYWLVRQGWEVTVVEQAPSLRIGGYAVDVRGKAIQVAKWMNIWDSILERKTHIQHTAFIHSAGGSQTRINLEKLKPDINKEVEIYRSDLVELLFAATRDDIEYVFDDAIAGLHQDTHGVDVSFKNGADRRFDIVLGADGQHSNTRNLIFGSESDFLHHLGAYICVFTLPNTFDLLDEVQLYNTPGKLAGVYTARNNTDAIGLFLFRDNEIPNLKYRDFDQQRKILRDRFQGQPWLVEKLLLACENSKDFYFDAVAQIRMPGFSSGCIALLGDAAYGPSPLSGQGTTLAMVGSYVLAQELLRCSDNIQNAYAAYFEKMQEYVRVNQALAELGFKILLPQKQWIINTRNKIVALMPLFARFQSDTNSKVDIASQAIDLSEPAVRAESTPK